MTDQVYSAVIAEHNQCPLMGVEQVIKSQIIGEHRVTITKDNFGQYRTTLKHMSSRTIVSGILFDQFRTVRFKYTLKGSRGNDYTKQLFAYTQMIVKRKFYHSEHLTEEGQAAI